MDARMYGRPNIEKLIKSFFYNGLANRVLDGGGDFNRDNINEKILKAAISLIREIIERSRGHAGLNLLDGVSINFQQCPDCYKELYQLLSDLKNKNHVSDQEIMAIAIKISQLESFQSINPAQSLLEMKNLTDVQLDNIHYDEQNISAELIRTTFYNEMLMQALLAIDQGWITYDDLDEEAANIYLTLPALTLLEAVQQSQNCNGIRLLDNKAVTLENCPQKENFPELVRAIMIAKTKIKAMSESELMVVKHQLASEQELPKNLETFKTNELMQTVAIIKGMSIEISRGRIFQQTVNEVIQRCLEMLAPPQEQASSRMTK